MDFRRLEAFRKVYEHRGFSKAGQELFLSQPTVSAHIASLEEELGAPLFDRLGRGILPTRAADILYRHSREIFERLGEAKAEVLALRERVSGDLALGASTIPAHHILPGLLSGFLAAYPEVTVKLTIADSARIAAMTLSGELTLGLVGARPEDPEIEVTPMMRDDLVVVAAPGLLAARGLDPAGASLSVAEAVRWPWVTREPGSGTRKVLETALGAAGFDPRRLPARIQTEGNETAVAYAKGGLGLALTSRLAARAAIERGELTVVAIPGLSFEREFYVIRHRKRHLFPAAARLVEAAKGWGGR